MIPFVVRTAFCRVWTRLTLKYIILSGICWWALSVQLRYRIPSSFLFLFIPWVGTALTALSFIFLAKNIFGNIPLLNTINKGIQKIEWWGEMFIRGFIYFSLVLFANGIMDFSEPTYHNSKVLEIFGAETQLGKFLPYAWADLNSWEKGRGENRVILQRKEKRRLWGGEHIIVHIHKGSLGIPWISKIERDKEKYALDTLKLTPTASAAWKRLIVFYIDHKRWEEAASATRKYLRIYPADYEYPLYVGSNLGIAQKYDWAVELLEHSISQKPTYAAFQSLGWALSYQGNGEKAAEILEKSIELNPYDYEAYYHLGYVYSQIGDVEKAIAMFEETLKRKSPYPEVENQLISLRHVLSLKKTRYKS